MCNCYCTRVPDSLSATCINLPFTGFRSNIIRFIAVYVILFEGSLNLFHLEWSDQVQWRIVASIVSVSRPLSFCICTKQVQYFSCVLCSGDFLRKPGYGYHYTSQCSHHFTSSFSSSFFLSSSSSVFQDLHFFLMFLLWWKNCFLYYPSSM